MKLLGVTGGIGMGKSTAGGLLEARGIRVVDSDALARQATESGTPGLAEIREAFGVAMLHPDGSLNRARLAEVVFSQTEARERLETILHPRIALAWRAQVQQWAREGQTHAAVLIPLLFERGYEAEFSAVVAVACTKASQRKRLTERGWSEGDIDARNAAQLPVEEKITRARFVVWTEGSIDVHARQWDRILAAL